MEAILIQLPGNARARKTNRVEINLERERERHENAFTYIFFVRSNLSKILGIISHLLSTFLACPLSD